MNLSEDEKLKIKTLIDAGEPLPDEYRFRLFRNPNKAELIWPGKTTEVTSVVLPFQSIEQIDEPRPETVPGTYGTGDLFSVGTRGRQDGGWSNKLIWGDNKLVLASLKGGPLRKEIEAAGGIKLIYIDPPFDVGDNFEQEISIGEEQLLKEPTVIETVAFNDTWGRGLDSYYAMIRERISLAYDLLSPDGSFYFHCDWRVVSGVRLIMDEIFGSQNFQREIIWRIGWISGYKSKAKNWIRNHDNILFYVKDPSNFIFNKEYIPYPPSYVRRDGAQPTGAGYPIEDTWNCSELDKLDSIQIMSFSGEKVGYPTQKNEALLNRVIRASSNPGDLVVDFFCGSGTTLATAEKLGRKWVGCDLGRFAIHTSRKRMIGVQRQLKTEGKPYRAFEILNLGKYERQYFANLDPTLAPADRARVEVQMEDRYVKLILQA